MNSTAFSLLANSNPEVDKNQKMELMIRSLSFYVGPLGSTCLSDPAKSGLSASKTKTITMSGSSVGSSSEVNSPVSFAATENTQKKLEEFNGTQGEPDVEVTVDRSHDSRRDFATGSSGVSRSIHQLCVIITEAAEENDHADNGEVNTQVDKLRSNGKKEKEKIHVSTGEWRIIMSAINHGTEVPANSRREVLMGYQYALHQRRKKLSVVGMTSRVGQGQSHLPADVPGISTVPSQEDRLRPEDRLRRHPAGDSTEESQSRRRR
jgi:hypothetical protein